MDTKKFEQLITLYLNEGNEEKARALFHDIIVEKSREIYESMLDMEEGAPVNDLMDEIEMEESGMNEDDMTEGGMYEADDEEDMDDMSAMGDEEDEFGDEEADVDDMGDIDDADMDDMEDMGDEEGDLEDRVVDIEDKLDELMSEFEALMGKDEEGADDEEAAVDDEEMAADDEEAAADDEEDAAGDEEEAEEMMEAKLNPVRVTKTSSPSNHGPALTDAKIKSDRHAFRLGGGEVSASKAAPAVKQVEGAGSFANRGGTTGVSMKSVAKPKAGDQSHAKSPVAVSESRVRKTVAPAKPAAKRK